MVSGSTNTLIENDAELLTSLHSKYITLPGKSDSKYPVRSLHEKLNISKFTENYQKLQNAGLIVYNGSLSEEAAIRKITFDEHSVKKMPPMTDVDELPDPHSRCFGQRTIRHSEIYSGSNVPTEKVKRQAQSTVDDTVTKSRNKQRKHLCVGMGLKSITGSRSPWECTRHGK